MEKEVARDRYFAYNSDIAMGVAMQTRKLVMVVMHAKAMHISGTIRETKKKRERKRGKQTNKREKCMGEKERYLEEYIREA